VGDGPAGDLYIEFRLVPHPRFSADGRDVHCELPIAPWEAALGAEVAVPTLGGNVKLKIPPNSQSGGRLRLKGRGLPGDPPGDQYVTLKVVLPPADTPTARALYERMATELAFDPREAR
jgi:curved DNA-binding protein